MCLMPKCGESRAAVFPMSKHSFVVGFLVAEFPRLEMPAGENLQSQGGDSPEKGRNFSSDSGMKSWDNETFNDEWLMIYEFSADQRSNAINISRSVAMGLWHIRTCLYYHWVTFGKDIPKT